jgi:hypothetical protein
MVVRIGDTQLGIDHMVVRMTNTQLGIDHMVVRMGDTQLGIDYMAVRMGNTQLGIDDMVGRMGDTQIGISPLQCLMACNEPTCCSFVTGDNTCNGETDGNDQRKCGRLLRGAGMAEKKWANFWKVDPPKMLMA